MGIDTHVSLFTTIPYYIVGGILVGIRSKYSLGIAEKSNPIDIAHCMLRLPIPGLLH